MNAQEPTVPRGGIEGRKGAAIYEGRKGATIYGFLVALLLKIKQVSAGVFQCKFTADECRFRHIVSLKEVTRSEAASALANTPHEGLKLLEDAAKDAE